VRTLRVDTWNDIVCPWCYVGEARLRKAAEALGPDVTVAIVPHAFELDPNHAHAEKVLDMLSRKYGTSPEQASQMDGRVAALAAAEGLPYTSDRVTVNTFDAHRLIAAADEVGARLELLHRLQRGHFSGEIDLSDADALVAAASALGLSEERAREVLAGDEYADAVRDDRATAMRLGVTGVPFTVIDQRFAIPGCVDVSLYETGLRRGLEG
jgi:predicted DsbA family dithiol-disulfide isomerase